VKGTEAIRSWAKTNLTARAGGDGAGPGVTAPAPGVTAAADPGQNGSSRGTAGSSAGRGARPATRRQSRRALKNWRVRSRLLLLIAIPTVTALALGGVRVTSAIQSALSFQRAEERAVLASNITQVAQRLETERDQTIYYIAMGSQGRAGWLDPKVVPAAERDAPAAQYKVIQAFYQQTDQTVEQFRARLAQFRGAYSGVAEREVSTAVAGLDLLHYLRYGSARTQLPALVVDQKYADLINDLLVVDDRAAQGTGDPELSQTVQVLGLVSRMKEEASKQRAILSAALLAGNLAPAQASALSTAQANQQSSQQAFNLSATPAQRAQFNNTVSGSFVYLAASQEQQAAALQAKQHSLSSDNISGASFYDAMSGGINQMGSVERFLANDIVTRANSLRGSAVAYSVLVGLAVFLLFTLALICTVVVGRSMVRPLRRLRAGALEVAGVRLPETVRQIDEGEGLAAPLHVQPIDVDSTDEIGEVARAFDQVHREAVRLAANEAALRGNVNAMFVNLSRRSQSLVERQIRLIDDLEQGEQDSERLANLFQMDHLATRMRRNSENLLVLAGHEVSRRWTGSVGLVDVLRAAVSEIEQYERVSLNVQPGIAVRGQAVNDVVHLLAELVENATSFSAAGTPVAVSGHLLNSGGALLDITDQGVGMGAEEMAHANWRLDNPPVVDVAVSRRMGLFVVARLAGRHGIRVRLRPASQGGLTALVWLPDEVISYETATVPAGLRRFETASTAAASTPATPAMASAGSGVAAAPAPEDGHVSVLGAPAGSSATVEAGQDPAPGLGDATLPSLASALSQDVIMPPVPSAAEATRLPIFESVESDWFRRSRHGAERPATAAPMETWSSPADEGWRAAEVAQSPVSGGTTAAGLPVRVPKANLVPGTVSGETTEPPPRAPARSAAQAQERLASFQRGIRDARAAAQGASGLESDEGTGEEAGDVTREADLSLPPELGRPAVGRRAQFAAAA
jgi:signal transduction histidine kinase